MVAATTVPTGRWMTPVLLDLVGGPVVGPDGSQGPRVPGSQGCDCDGRRRRIGGLGGGPSLPDVGPDHRGLVHVALDGGRPAHGSRPVYRTQRCDS